MSDDNVVILSGPTKLDIPPERILNSAIDAKLDVAMVLGFDAEGELYAACSTGDEGTLLRLIERFKHKLLSGDYE
jgi:hypothetical protein